MVSHKIIDVAKKKEWINVFSKEFNKEMKKELSKLEKELSKMDLNYTDDDSIRIINDILCDSFDNARDKADDKVYLSYY